MLPDWDDLPACARHEYARDQPAGHLRPRLLLFHDGVATVYVRARPRRSSEAEGATIDGVLLEMASLTGFLRPDAVAVLAQCRTSEGDRPVRPADDPLAEDAILVQRRWWLGEPGGSSRTVGDLTIQPKGRDDDGRTTWAEATTVADGPFTALLDRCIGHGPAVIAADGGMTAAGAAYALTKFGHVIGVHPQWRARFALDEPVAPRLVRPGDRDRARRLAQAHRRRTRRATSATAAAAAGRGPEVAS